MEMLHALLIAPNEESVESLDDALRHGGFASQIVRVDGAEALSEALSREGSQAVLCDPHTPGLDGRKALRTLKSAGSEAPFLVFAESIDPEDAAELIQAGCHHFITHENRGLLAPLIRHELDQIERRKKAENERRDLEMQLRMAQKMEALGTLAGGIAHDFNNILTIILGLCDLAQLDLPEKSPIRKYLSGAMEAGMRARGLVRQILTFSRQRGDELVAVDLVQIVSEVYRLLRSALPSTIEIRCDLPATGVVVTANPSLMHQVLMNLCTNSAQAMPDGGFLGLELTSLDPPADSPEAALGACAVIRVRDTGGGIPEEIRERIFDPYFTTKSVSQGTGLGLAVVQGAIKNLHGRIRLDSEIGRGTVFEIFLPLGSSLPEEEADPIFGEVAKGAGERVLFVDDEELISMLAQAYLGDVLGYEITLCANGAEALEALQNARFDVVVTDLTMPKVDGTVLIREIRKRWSALPVILCTGFENEQAAAKAADLEVDEMLLKPVLPEEIGRAVARVLGRRRSPEPIVETRPEVRLGTDSCSILLVDDEIDFCEALREVLEDCGHRVDLAHSGRQALEACTENDYDIVFLDLGLPDRPGAELIFRLEEAHPRIEILIISGQTASDTSKAVSRSTIGFLHKPVDLERLLAILAGTARRRRMARERDALLEKLEEKNIELESYAYSVSHDLKSPLITIQGFVGLMRRRIKELEDDRLDAHLTRIDDAASHMGDLLEGLLRLSRLDRFSSATEDVSLRSLAEEVVDLIAVEGRGVDFRIDPDLPAVRGDRLRLLQVFQNLIVNAVRYMGDQAHPRVEIGTRRDSEGEVFYVRDNGMGIEPRDHQKVFDLFTRLRSDIHGTGIGLAMVARILRNQGGRVWVESQGLGHGACFCFTLPVHPARDAEHKEEDVCAS